MGTQADRCAYLFVASLAALSSWSSACDYDDGGFAGATPIDVVRDAAPATRDTRGSTPATDASSGLGATSVKPPDAAASPPDAGAAAADDAGAVDGAAPPPDAPPATAATRRPARGLRQRLQRCRCRSAAWDRVRAATTSASTATAT